MLRGDGPVSFEGFVLDAANAELSGPNGPVHLGRKALRVLEALVAQPGRLLTKDELFEAVWDGSVVSESALTTVIKELRRALGDALRQLQGLTPEQLVEQRVQRVLSYGAFQEVRA